MVACHFTASGFMEKFTAIWDSFTANWKSFTANWKSFTANWKSFTAHICCEMKENHFIGYNL